MLGWTGAKFTRADRAGRPLAQVAIFTIFLAVTTLCAPFLSTASAQSYTFSQVEIQGNARVDAATVLSYAGIGRGQSISAGELNDAYQRLVNSGLFETVELLPQGGTLVIRVAEFPMLNVVDFQGNKRLKDDELSAAIQSRSRLVYSPAQAESDAAAIAEIYTASGRIAATVDPRIIRRSDNRVDLVFEITEGKVVEIERLSFIGNRAFSDRRLRQVLQTKQAGLLRNVIQRDSFVPERIDLDKQLLTDFYTSRGYVDFQILDAAADVSRQRDAYFVAFTIREGQLFTVGKVSASSEVDGVNAAEFQAVARVKTGQVYTPNGVDNTIARMEDLALKKGLNFVHIEPRITRNDRNQSLDIDFALVKGERAFVERIDIEGNTTTLDQVVRRQFRTVEGDPFNPREIRQAAERIRALGYFVNADVAAEAGSGPDQVVVKVNVEEQPTGSLSFGATYGVSNGFGINVGFAESNFLGRGQQLTLNIQSGVDNVNSVLDFVEPAFLGRDLRFHFGAGYLKTTQDAANYDTKVVSIGPGFEFPISERGRVELRYKLARESILNVDLGTVDDPLTIDVDETSNGSSIILQAEVGTELSSALGYSYSYDTRRSRLGDKGFLLLRFGQDFAGVGGDVSSITSSGLALAETTVLNDQVAVRAIFEGGMITGLNGYTTRVTDRYFGNGKIRGFEPNGIGPRDLGADNQDALGGNMFAVARFESDFPLGLPEEYGIKGGAFFDVGSVWGLDNRAGTAGTVDDSLHLRAVAGLSVFWTTPIGPLRFNFTNALRKETYDLEQTFDLTISTKF